MMTVVYNAILSSKSKLVDGLPVSLKYPAPIQAGTKFKSVDPLCKNATDKEIKWYKECVEPCIVK